jgi:hypothetical protein
MKFTSIPIVGSALAALFLCAGLLAGCQGHSEFAGNGIKPQCRAAFTRWT